MSTKIKLTLDNIGDVGYGDTLTRGDYSYTVEWCYWGLCVDGVPLRLFLEGEDDVYYVERGI